MKFVKTTMLPLLGGILMSLSVRAQLTTTNLPILIIQTPAAIVDTYVQASLNIIDNVSGTNNITDAPTFTGTIGIKTRGNTALAKLSYSIETWTAPNVSLDTALLGLPSENDWVLMSSYTDRSLMRDALSKLLHESMGRYAPRNKHCEVVLNGQYVGVYLFGEKIKRNFNRLDLAKLTVSDNFGENLTGGYIWRLNDGTGADWTSSYVPPFGTTQQSKFQYEYPDASDITPAQEAYSKSYVDSFENAMNAANFQDSLLGWRRFGAVNGFADFMIINEVTRNIDAYRNNVFLYKDKSKKMRPGPIWAFDNAIGNTASCNSAVDTGWCYNLGGTCPAETKLAPFWWSKLSTDTAYMKDLKCLYSEYRKPGRLLDTVKLFANIDSMATRLTAQNAVARNFTQWPIWGVPLVNEPTPMPANYTEEIASLKTFFRKRLTWLDTKWVLNSGCPAPVSVPDVDLSAQVTIFPNPVNQQLHVSYSGSAKNGYTLQLLTVQGSSVKKITSKETQTTMDLSGLPNGIYLLRITGSKGSITRKIVKE